MTDNRKEYERHDDAAERKLLTDRIAELEAQKWDVQHTDTMNDLVQMGIARDQAEARIAELEGLVDAKVHHAYRQGRLFQAPLSTKAALREAIKASKEPIAVIVYDGWYKKKWPVTSHGYQKVQEAVEAAIRALIDKEPTENKPTDGPDIPWSCGDEGTF